MSQFETAFRTLFPAYREIASPSGPAGGDILLPERRAKGSYLCHAGDPLTKLFFLLEGTARVFLPLYGGHNFLFRVYQPGDVVGDLEFFLDSPATCSVQCTSKVVLCSYPVDRLRLDSARLSSVVHALGVSVATKLKENTISEAVNTGYSVTSRLAAYFVTHRDPDLRARNLQELSEWLGTSYRHLTRTLHRLTEEGILRKTGRRYGVADEARLRRLAAEVLAEDPPRI